MRRAALIYNPTAGRGRYAAGARRRPRHTCRRRASTRAGADRRARPGDRAGRRLAREGRVEAVFALGGDGTAREVAAGLLGSRRRSGILPGGTANLMALAWRCRATRWPRPPCSATPPLAAVRRRHRRRHPFLMMISAGLDARALAALDRGLEGAARQARGRCAGRAGVVALRVPRDRHRGGRRTAAPATFARGLQHPLLRRQPSAWLPARCRTTGGFELVTFHGSGRAATLGFILGVVSGRHTRRADVGVRTVEEVVFTVPPEAGVQVDGDPLPGAATAAAPTPGGTVAPRFASGWRPSSSWCWRPSRRRRGR